MLWKELYIERVGTLGRFGRWLGVLITVFDRRRQPGARRRSSSRTSSGRVTTDWSLWATNVLSVVFTDASGRFMGWLLQWAIGLRAAVSIASERERGTWDALLMSPLEPGEIVRAKLSGSLYALRWMAGAMVLAWTLAVMVGAVPAWAITSHGSPPTRSAGAFMAAVGVRCSLSLPTATKAMTWTIALWLASIIGVAVLAFSLIALVFAGVLRRLDHRNQLWLCLADVDPVERWD